MKIAILTNFISPYNLPIYEAFSNKVEHLKIFLSTPMEENRNWAVNWGSLNVKLQNSMCLITTWKHPYGFQEKNYLYFPYKTIIDMYQYRPDVLISTQMGFRTLQACIYKKLFPQTKLIIWVTLSEYTETGRGKLREIIRPWMIRLSDALIVNGASGSRYISKMFPKEQKAIHFVPYVAKNSLFSVKESNKSNVVNSFIDLVYIGQLVERKGLLPFINVLINWSKSNVTQKIRFHIAGSGPQIDQIRSITPPKNLELILYGNVEYEKLPEVYSKGDIFVFPTLADEWGVVVNEAMASGIPVLGSIRSQAVEELIENGKTGWTFLPEDLGDMRKALELALSITYEERRLMGTRAKSVIGKFDCEFAAEKLKDAVEYVNNNS